MFVAPFASERHSATPIESAYLVSVMAATELVGRLPWGIIADKPGINRHFLLALDCLGMGITFFLIPFMPSYTAIAVVYGLSGFFQGRKKILPEVGGGREQLSPENLCPRDLCPRTVCAGDCPRNLSPRDVCPHAFCPGPPFSIFQSPSLFWLPPLAEAALSNLLM